MSRVRRDPELEELIRALDACAVADCDGCPYREKKRLRHGCMGPLLRGAAKWLRKPPEGIPADLLEHLRSGCTVMPVGALQFRPDPRFPRIRLPGSSRMYVIFPASPGEKEKEDDHDET